MDIPRLLDTIPHLKIVAIVASLFGAGAVLAWRVRETRTAVSAAKILIPPLGMATGFCMFLSPEMRVPLDWGLGAYLVGALLLAVPLKRTSKLSRQGDEIRMQRSRAFLLILLALVTVELVARSYFELETRLTALQTSALVYLEAFGMISRWRASMFLEFRRLRSDMPPAPPQVA